MFTRKKKKISPRKPLQCGVPVLCDWHSRMRLSCMAALELDAQMFSHWKSKGPNLNFIIQPDIADQQNVLTQKYDNKPSRWRMASGGGWVEGGRVGMGEEVVERGGCTFPHLSCIHMLKCGLQITLVLPSAKNGKEDPLLFNPTPFKLTTSLDNRKAVQRLKVAWAVVLGFVRNPPNVTKTGLLRKRQKSSVLG